MKKDPVFGMACFTGTTCVIENIAMSGLDFIYLDLEHTNYMLDEAFEKQIMAAKLHDISVLVRMADDNEVAIRKVLEWGADGVVIPHCKTAEMARRSVEGAKFAPLGRRGGETNVRAAGFGYHNFDWNAYIEQQNRDTLVIPMDEDFEFTDNIDEILEVAYGIMIARGDLGIEVPAEKIPGIQRVLIRKCVEVKKPVIVATQMLHSMISNPRPTRAEVTDIANAIYYRTDALMLSGETAYGKYPVEAVQTMTKVAREAEKTKLAANDIRVPIEGNDLDVTSFLAKQAVKSSSKLHVKAIITDSYTGRTARYLAAFRGTSTVFSICYNPRVMRMLSLSYGVWAVHQPYNDSRRGYFYDALNELIKSGRITRNDMVAYLSGSFGEGGGTSFLEINNVGKVWDAGSNYQLPTFKE